MVERKGDFDLIFWSDEQLFLQKVPKILYISICWTFQNVIGVLMFNFNK